MKNNPTAIDDTNYNFYLSSGGTHVHFTADQTDCMTQAANLLSSTRYSFK